MNVFIVTYDISDNGRRTRVYDCLRAWGDHLQYSVFRCVLSRAQRAELRAELDGMIDHNADQILFVDVGPDEGRGKDAFDALGIPYTHPERHAVIY